MCKRVVLFPNSVCALRVELRIVNIYFKTDSFLVTHKTISNFGCKDSSMPYKVSKIIEEALFGLFEFFIIGKFIHTFVAFTPCKIYYACHN